MGSPDERAFVVFERGYVRDNIILAQFRNELRAAVNPVTNELFTEDEVLSATAPGTRFYIEADAIDLVGQATQARALFFAAQVDPRTANSDFLRNYHGELWLGDGSALPATPSSGPVLANATPGTIFPGSSIVPNFTVAIATDPNGNRYQNLADAVTGPTGEVLLNLVGLDTGFVTRLPAGTELRWSANTNPGTFPTCVVQAGFDGGFDEETDEEYSERIVERIRFRPASGNAVHFQTWGQESSGAIAQPFVYPAALNAGSVVVAITEKRATQVSGIRPEGPLARVPSIGTLNSAAAYLIPPASSVVPEGVFVLVTGITPQSSHLVMRIGMSVGRSGGWTDSVPWPPYSASYPEAELDTVSLDGLTLTMTYDQSLPGEVASLSGVDVPSMMVFNEEISRWVELDIDSITDAAPGTSSARTFTIVLNVAPVVYDEDGVERLLLVGDRISPSTDQHESIAVALEAYFDSLGPGELIASTDTRYARAARRPTPSMKFPWRAGQAMVGFVQTALGGVAGDVELTSISRNEPDIPSNLVDGPNMITFGRINVYPL